MEAAVSMKTPAHEALAHRILLNVYNPQSMAYG
jgi:hypothetical protein